MKLRALLEDMIDDFERGIRDLFDREIIGKTFGSYTVVSLIEVSNDTTGGMDPFGNMGRAGFNVTCLIKMSSLPHPQTKRGNLAGKKMQAMVDELPKRFKINGDLVHVEWKFDSVSSPSFLYGLHVDKSKLPAERDIKIPLEIWGWVSYVDRKVEINRRREEKLTAR